MPSPKPPAVAVLLQFSSCSLAVLPSQLPRSPTPQQFNHAHQSTMQKLTPRSLADARALGNLENQVLEIARAHTRYTRRLRERARPDRAELLARLE
jgi:hypothetical protein